MSALTRRTKVRSLATVAGLMTASMVLVGCSGGGDQPEDAGEFTYLANAASAIIPDELTALAEDQCAAENEAMPLSIETLPQEDVNTRLVLLASQDALPVTFVAPTAELRPGGALGDDDVVLDLEATLTELGVIDNILPGAIETVKNIYGGRFVSLPYQLNIEGIFYNKVLFDELGIEVPTTWDEFLDAADALQAAGKTPIALAGSQSWLLNRWIGNSIYRELGPDALTAVNDGDAELTDARYVEAIQRIADLQGYFGPGFATMDAGTMTGQFLSGEAGMIYNGSWFLADINNEELNQIGVDAVGFTSFPAVEGGEGTVEQFPANAGAATSFSASLYSDTVGDWLTCITENYGSSVLNNQGVISGFRLNQETEEQPELNQLITEYAGENSEPLAWFEASFGTRAGAAAGENASLLFTGSITAEEWASIVQAAVEQDRAG